MGLFVALVLDYNIYTLIQMSNYIYIRRKLRQFNCILPIFHFVLADYPFINYYVIEKPACETETFFKRVRTHANDRFSASRLANAGGVDGAVGYRCGGGNHPHFIDVFEEVATIARPPVQTQSKKPVGDNTGYIICVYRVFKGDDGEKFERNWLYWTGRLLLYKV